ncbi:MAG: tetratricopeptide repeat protein [Rubrivivax sp.]
MSSRSISCAAGLLLGLVLTMTVPPAVAAPPLPPARQAALDAAVRDHEAGRVDAARSAFQQLSRHQVPAADYNLAVMHLRGEMPRSDRATARRLLERAGANGFVTAQFMLGRALETGELGARDLVLAHRWYGAAAASGSVDAQVAMGTAHYLGRGMPKDLARAAHWFREAAKAGDVGAQYLLASMYEAGDGVAKDLRLARYWYDIAARNGDEAAPGKLQEIDARLGALPG